MSVRAPFCTLGAHPAEGNLGLGRTWLSYAETLSLSLSAAAFAHKMENQTMKIIKALMIRIWKMSTLTRLNLYWLFWANQSDKYQLAKIIVWH
jgi:hypothetical protein